MPNYCDFTMKIVGSRKDCRTFMTRLVSYDVPNHFYRIFEADVYDEREVEGTTSLYISGYCAWSLYTCCKGSGYFDGDLFEINTRELNLKMEAYSHEPGVGFEEHYIYDHGKCVEDSCIDMTEWLWDVSEFPTYEAFKEEYPDAPPEDDFYDDRAVVGGFGDEYCYWNI